MSYEETTMSMRKLRRKPEKTRGKENCRPSLLRGKEKTAAPSGLIEIEIN
jgi:hypothetical protein